MLNKGVIRGFGGSDMSHYAYLILADCETRIWKKVPCEKEAVIKALADCYPDSLNADGRIDVEQIIGHEIFWRYDDTGTILSGFSPVEEANEEVWNMYLNKTELVEQD